jgi:hypothetical protein
VIVVICKGSTQVLQALEYCSSALFCLLSPYPPLSQQAARGLALSLSATSHLVVSSLASRSAAQPTRLHPSLSPASHQPLPLHQALPFISHLQTRPTSMVFYNLKALIKAIRATKTIADERALIVKESAVIRTSFKEEGESRDELVRVGSWGW